MFFNQELKLTLTNEKAIFKKTFLATISIQLEEI